METNRIILVSYDDRKLGILCGNKTKEYIVCLQTEKTIALLNTGPSYCICIPRSEKERYAKTNELETLCTSVINDAFFHLTAVHSVFILIPQQLFPLMIGYLDRFKKRSYAKNSKVPRFQTMIEPFLPQLPLHLFKVYYRKAKEYYPVFYPEPEHYSWEAFLEPYAISKKHMEQYALEYTAQESIDALYAALKGGDGRRLENIDLQTLDELLNLAIDRHDHGFAHMLATVIEQNKRTK